MHYVQTELNINGLNFPKKEIELKELEKRSNNYDGSIKGCNRIF